MDTLLGLIILAVFCYGAYSLFQKARGQNKPQNQKKTPGTRYYYGEYITKMSSIGKFHHQSPSSYPPKLSIDKVGVGVNLICEVVPIVDGADSGYMHLWSIILDDMASDRLSAVISYLESLY